MLANFLNIPFTLQLVISNVMLCKSAFVIKPISFGQVDDQPHSESLRRDVRHYHINPKPILLWYVDVVPRGERCFERYELPYIAQCQNDNTKL